MIDNRSTRGGPIASAIDIPWNEYSTRQLIKAALGNKSDLERKDLYGLMEELAERSLKIQDALDRF